MKDIVVDLLKKRGVNLEELAELVFELQKPYLDDIELGECLENVSKVLEKREVQHAILTGIQLDILAEKNLIEEPLLSIIKTDEPLYGMDEILSLSITNVYGSIGFTNFGYLDKLKPGIIGKVDKLGKTTDSVHTFLDDLLGGIVAAACARIAHSKK